RAAVSTGNAPIMSCITLVKSCVCVIFFSPELRGKGKGAPRNLFRDSNMHAAPQHFKSFFLHRSNYFENL
ncbi:MAG: hypothetical protein ACC631_03500, partial [Halocynthiibacter sp.]